MHFYIWAAIVGIATGTGAAGWFLRKLWVNSGAITGLIEGVLAQYLDTKTSQGFLNNAQATFNADVETRTASLKAWADSYSAFYEHASRLQSERVDDLNKRLIQIETENKTITPEKKDEDEDPFNGPRSWAAQAAAAERGAGVRVIA